MNTSLATQTYIPDILGTGYEQLTLNFPNDYEKSYSHLSP